jgi:hypothetical protein
MNRATCAYCKEPEVLTREHLWPTSLHERLVKAGEHSKNFFWLARLRKDIPNEPQIRDVCAGCNNGVLSELDAYICEFFDRVLVRIPQFDDRVPFEYDYHLLKRWLLKLSFNSARIHNARDLFALEAVLAYIRGKDISLGRSVQLFVQLSYPEVVPEEDLRDGAPVPRPVIWEPTMHRAGHMYFRVPTVGAKLLRTVHLRAFGFFLAFFEPGERRNVMYDFEHAFTQRMRSTIRLRPGQGRVQLRCNGVGAWESYRGSRENRLVFRGEP